MNIQIDKQINEWQYRKEIRLSLPAIYEEKSSLKFSKFCEVCNKKLHTSKDKTTEH